jgi:glycine oxidase
VDPVDVMRALHAACLARGVELREGTAVRRIEASRGEVRVDGEAAARAVLAAGAWSSSIEVTVEGEAWALPRAYPVRGHLIGYSEGAGRLGPILRHHHTYLLQRSNGYTIAGTTAEEAGFDRTVSAPRVEEIREKAERLAPRLRAATRAGEWMGFRPAIARDAPAMERAGDSALCLAYGHYRNGILLAPASAERVAGMVAG